MDAGGSATHGAVAEEALSNPSPPATPNAASYMQIRINAAADSALLLKNPFHTCLTSSKTFNLDMRSFTTSRSPLLLFVLLTLWFDHYQILDRDRCLFNKYG